MDGPTVTEGHNTCRWTESDPDMGTWETECGECFVFEVDSPKENGMKFCCYCGKPLRQTGFREKS